MSRGDACVAPAGWLAHPTPSTACLRASLIVREKMNHRDLIDPRDRTGADWTTEKVAAFEVECAQPATAQPEPAGGGFKVMAARNRRRVATAGRQFPRRRPIGYSPPAPVKGNASMCHSHCKRGSRNCTSPTVMSS